MITGDGVVEDAQVEATSGLEQPFLAGLSIASEFEEELLAMAAMGEVPNEARAEVAVCARHRISSPRFSGSK